MSDLTIIKKGNLPTYDDSDCSLVSVGSGMASGTKFIRLDGKEFAMVDGGVKTPIGKSLTGVVINAGPISKRFYKKAFSGTNTHAPDCASADGEKPDAAIIDPICGDCETCPNNAWGSRAGYTGKKAKACQEYRRLVVCVTDQDDNHLLYRLDVPAASLNNLRVYGSLLQMHRVPIFAVLTKFSFDPTANYQKLKFDAVKAFTNEQAAVYKSMGQADDAQNMLTMQSSSEVEGAEEDAEEDEDEVEAPKRKKTVKRKAAPQAAPAPKKRRKVKKMVEVYEDEEDEVEEDEAIEVTNVEDLENELDNVLMDDEVDD